MSGIRVAILDMNNNVSNKGLGYIKSMIAAYEEVQEWNVFDVRAKGEVPDTSYDIYVSSGGPGSPFEMDGDWDVRYSALLEDILAHNASNPIRKKYMFLICHSFQVACIHFGIGTVCQRNAMSFGIYPVTKTDTAANDAVFGALPQPFYTADFRHWQVINPSEEALAKHHSSVLALEHLRADFPNERALMAIRFSPEMIGTQFHPEADAEGMLQYLTEDERRFKIIEEHGEEKYKSMLADLHDPLKIALTYSIILPTFMADCFRALASVEVTELV